jgi:hypothetical protein
MNVNSDNRIQRISAVAAVALVLLFALWAMTRQWDKPLLDLHAFRQTQTAISTYYMAKDAGMFFNYITPVLGKPWSIPMELPIYQWIVARWHNISGMGLDQSGRSISISLWFACIWPIWRLLGSLGQTTVQRCLSLTLIYSSPLYLYWGRSFMIESTGLFLSLGMVACIYTGYTRQSWKWLLGGLALGIGAALCKVTTWAVSVGVAELLIISTLGKLPQRKDLKRIAAASAALILPILPAKLWLAHGDTSKAQNLFAKELILSTSSNQRSWNFGTLDQKLDPATWQHIGRHIADQLLAPNAWIGGLVAVAILIAGALCTPRRIPIMLAFIAGFAAGPLVFTNLYFEHNYYWFANSIWLLLAIGTALGAIDEKLFGKWPKLVPVVIAITLAGSSFFAWNKRFLPILENLPEHKKLTEVWIQPVQHLVPPDKILIIIGQDWNPTALYYAGRKGIMLPAKSTDPFNDLQKCIAKLDPDEVVGAVCIAQSILTPENQEAFARALNLWGVSLQGTPSPFGVLFIASSP